MKPDATKAALQGAAGAGLGSAVARPLVIADGSLEALKWVALVLMTIDHINKYLLHAGVPWMFAAGRLAMPLFAFVLAYNLARPDALAIGIYKRAAVRLACFGAMASVPAVALGGLGWGWWPLNVMATLLAATLCIGLLNAGGFWRITGAVAVFVVCGSSVEFWWPGVGACVAAWAFCRHPSWGQLAVWCAAVGSLYVINRNFWALAALPLIFAATSMAPALPRARYWFYVYFPLRLAVLWCVRTALE